MMYGFDLDRVVSGGRISPNGAGAGLAVRLLCCAMIGTYPLLGWVHRDASGDVLSPISRVIVFGVGPVCGGCECSG